MVKRADILFHIKYTKLCKCFRKKFFWTNLRDENTIKKMTDSFLVKIIFNVSFHWRNFSTIAVPFVPFEGTVTTIRFQANVKIVSAKQVTSTMNVNYTHTMWRVHTDFIYTAMLCELRKRPREGAPKKVTIQYLLISTFRYSRKQQVIMSCAKHLLFYWWFFYTLNFMP